MGLFSKKDCDICGKKVGFLGNRKLSDGNMCSECSSLLSPLFAERRKTTVADIKEQLVYREANKAQVAEFNVTKSIGGLKKILLDENAEKFIVTMSDMWRGGNPDVISFSQITNCQVDVREYEEYRNEITYTDREGKRVSYVPRRYEKSYDVYLVLFIDSPWFNKIEYQINKERIQPQNMIAYDHAKQQADELIKILQARNDSMQ